MKSALQKRRRISVPVLTKTGATATLTGIHAGHGALLGVEGGSCWPDVPWIKRALQRATALQKDIEAIHNATARYGISRYYLPRGNHEQAIDRLLELIEENKAAALAAAPKDEN